MSTDSISRALGLALDARNVRIVRRERGRVPRILLDIPHLAIPAQGQIAIVGPPAAGKSRLLRVLAAFERPASGGIWWGAIDIAAMDATAGSRWRRSTVGIVTPKFRWWRSLSAYHYAATRSRLEGHRLSKQLRAQLRALLQRSGINASARIGALSAAELRDIDAVCALATVPEILMADEPAGGMWPGEAERIIDNLRILAGMSGATLVMTTRDAGLARDMDAVYEIAFSALRRIQ